MRRQVYVVNLFLLAIRSRVAFPPSRCPAISARKRFTIGRRVELQHDTNIGSIKSPSSNVDSQERTWHGRRSTRDVDDVRAFVRAVYYRRPWRVNSVARGGTDGGSTCVRKRVESSETEWGCKLKSGPLVTLTL